MSWVAPLISTQADPLRGLARRPEALESDHSASASDNLMLTATPLAGGSHQFDARTHHKRSNSEDQVRAPPITKYVAEGSGLTRAERRAAQLATRKAAKHFASAAAKRNAARPQLDAI
jgi:hypothetical protein